VRAAGVGLAVLMAAMLAGPAAQAGEKYPSRPIQWIVGWGAGGGTDVFTRGLVKGVQERLGTPIAVQNMPGASSATALDYVMNQPADGYTVFSITSDLLQNAVLKRGAHTFRDLTLLVRAHVDVGLIHAGPQSPFKTWAELVAQAKANPGKQTWTGTGAGSSDEINSAIVSESAGIAIKYVPYEAASEMHAALLGGHVQAMYEEPGPAIGLIDAGRVKPLLVLTDKRLDRFPNVPCAKELGLAVPPFLWRGVAVKKGTPPEVVDALLQAIQGAMKAPEYRQFEEKRLLTLYPGFLVGEEFARTSEREYELYANIMKRLGLVK
jgi:putative tricarboxylic transport membrane protein